MKRSERVKERRSERVKKCSEVEKRKQMVKEE